MPQRTWWRGDIFRDADNSFSEAGGGKSGGGLVVSSLFTLACDLSVEVPIFISEHTTFLCNILKMEDTHQTIWY